MIVGHYQLDLCCEDESHHLIRTLGGDVIDLSAVEGAGPIGFARFHAVGGELARGAARAAGWRLDLEAGEAWCPAHSSLKPSEES